MQTKHVAPNEFLSYNLDNELKTQEDADLMSAFFDYSGDSYICDVISEIADYNVGIYNKEILENAWGLYVSDAYEDASADGIMENGNDLIKNLQCAWWYYNEKQLSNNINTLIYNFALDQLNSNGFRMSNNFYLKLEEELNEICSDNTLEDITRVVERLVIEEELPFD